MVLIEPVSELELHRERLRFAIREEVRLNVMVDLSLVGLADLCELNAHPEPAIGPADATLDVDFNFSRRHTKTHAYTRIDG